VIAVPVCGFLILIVLILVARRLLRTDEEKTKSHDQSSYKHHGPTHNGHVKPVFLEPSQFLLPHIPCYQQPTTKTVIDHDATEVDELVRPNTPPHYCHCSRGEGQTAGFCSIRPPPIMLASTAVGRGFGRAESKKFSLLVRLGLKTDPKSQFNFNRRPPNIV
jgi:hypothetical protein